MKDQNKAEDMAAQRVQLLSPLLTHGLDPAKASQIKVAICEQTGLSERTVRRYLAQYRLKGFPGLRPKGKGRQVTHAIPAHLLEQAILLRREVPSRSVSQIIQILEWEGKAQPGQLKRSTLQEKLAERGFSTRHMRMYTGGGVAARRFQKRHRNQLWQSDIKYGPYLPIGPDGSNKQVYLVLFVDDADSSFMVSFTPRWISPLSRIAFENRFSSMRFQKPYFSTMASNTAPNGCGEPAPN